MGYLNDYEYQWIFGIWSYFMMLVYSTEYKFGESRNLFSVSFI